jgi:phosphate transport system substrate-binding protein
MRKLRLKKEMNMTKNFVVRFALPAVAIVAIAAGAAFAADPLTLTAAGATFPYPIYSKWFDSFQKKTGTQINYQSIGSGGGIAQLTAGTVDFGASDRPMTDEELKKTGAFHFPTVLGAVVATYNIEGKPADLKFTGDSLAGVFMGTIKKWNDPAIAKANPGVKLPDSPITVIVRSDSSGTSFVFTDYLSKVNAAWKAKVGANSSPNWPAGLRGKGSEGVSGLVKQTPNSIGFVELTYALQNKMAYGSVQNAAGKFIKADLATTTAAAAGFVKTMPDDFRVSITNAPGAGAYPISTFTYLLIPTQIKDAAKKKAIVDFLTWMLKDGQTEAGALSYAPLPKEVIAKEVKAIANLN